MEIYVSEVNWILPHTHTHTHGLCSPVISFLIVFNSWYWFGNKIETERSLQRKIQQLRLEYQL